MGTLPLADDHLQIPVIDPGRLLDDLRPIALINRSELAERDDGISRLSIATKRTQDDDSQRGGQR